MRLKIPLVTVVSFLGLQAFAADFSYAGDFVRDDENRQFTFTLLKPAKVTIRTTSYAGGPNAAGEQVARGGFDPTLSLFDASGALIALNRDGGCDKVRADLVTGYCWDALIEAELPVGTWQVVLTQSENLPNGPNLSDSFVYDGTGNFTADPEGDVNQGFWDFSPNRRTGAWALDIRGVDGSLSQLGPQSGIVNSASFLGGSVGPNTILTLISPGLNADPSTTVTVDGITSEVLYAGASQINFVVPPGVIPKAGAAINIRRGSNVLLSTTIDISDASPGLFTTTQNGSGQAAVIDILDSGSYAFNGALSPSAPAARGSYIEIFGTGFGAANPPGPDGLAWLVQPVTVAIGGVPAHVLFAGLAPKSTMGLQQVNVLIPDDCPVGPAVSVRVQVGTHVTQSQVTVAIN